MAERDGDVWVIEPDEIGPLLAWLIAEVACMKILLQRAGLLPKGEPCTLPTERRNREPA
jgi:hypothetical protein